MTRAKLAKSAKEGRESNSHSEIIASLAPFALRRAQGLEPLGMLGALSLSKRLVETARTPPMILTEN